MNSLLGLASLSEMMSVRPDSNISRTIDEINQEILSKEIHRYTISGEDFYLNQMFFQGGHVFLLECSDMEGLRRKFTAFWRPKAATCSCGFAEARDEDKDIIMMPEAIGDMIEQFVANKIKSNEDQERKTIQDAISSAFSSTQKTPDDLNVQVNKAYRINNDERIILVTGMSVDQNNGLWTAYGLIFDDDGDRIRGSVLLADIGELYFSP